MKKFILSVSLLSLLTMPLLSKSWTLSACIEHAHAHNIQIKRTELLAKLSRIDKTQALTNITPDLNARIQRNYSFGRQVDPYTNQYIETDFTYDNYSITSYLTLFNGLQNYNNILRSKYASLAAIQQVERVKVEQAMAISAAYLNLLFQQEQVQVQLQQLEIMQQQVVRIQKLVEAGSVAQGVLLEIEAQLASEVLHVTNAQNQADWAKLSLIQLLDLESTEGFEIVTPVSMELNNLNPLTSVTEVYEIALSYLPHIKQSEYEVQSAEKFLAIQKGRRSPRFYASGSIYTGYSSQRTQFNSEVIEQEIGYLQSDPTQRVMQSRLSTIEYPYNNQLEDNIAQAISLGVSLPIVNRWEVNNSISRARIQMEDSQYALDQNKQELLKEIQQAYNDAQSARDQYRSATQAAASYREAFRYTEQKFNVGMVNSIEYNVSKNNLIRAESEQLQAKYAYVFAIKLLGLYQGVPISL